MVDEIRSWFKDNHTLVVFLGAQLVTMGAAAAAFIAYAVKLETRVTIMETRGAEYTVARMDEMRRQIAVLEEKIEKNEDSIVRIVNEYLRNRK